MNYNSIGLDAKKSKVVAEHLNLLLANFQTYYQNLRGIHWNIKGKRFFDLHVKFEELYTDANEKIDEIAERILTLGVTPYHTMQDYIEKSQVPVGKDVYQDVKAIELIVESLSALLKIERDVLEYSSDLNDEGTTSMISEFISQQEKTVWMMKAWLGECV